MRRFFQRTGLAGLRSEPELQGVFGLRDSNGWLLLAAGVHLLRWLRGRADVDLAVPAILQLVIRSELSGKGRD